MISYLNQMTRFVVSHQRVIIKVLLSLEISLLVVWGIIFWSVISGNSLDMYVVSEVGKKLGVFSLGLFCVTLIPGIITRLRWFPLCTQPFAVMITPIRRHLGILMFLTAFVHMSFVLTLPYIAQTLAMANDIQSASFAERLSLAFSSLPPPVVLFEQLGIIAWILLLPVWLTSNDFSQKKLGKNWKKIQRLTYVVLWFIFAHVALQGEGLAVILGIVGCFEIASWVILKRRQQVITSK